jgi:3-oxoacyl-[acyl-carrier-protein] synthase II
MMRIAIRGIGITGGFGCGIDQLRQTLVSRENAPQHMALKAGNVDFEIPVFLCDTALIERYINKRALRRVDHYSRMAALASYLALEDAGRLPQDLHQMAVVVASGYGSTRTTFSFLDSVFKDGDACASPTMFSNSVHNAAAAHISIFLKARGPNLTISQFEMSIPSALLTACRWLHDKQADAVLFGGVDEHCSVLGYSWQCFFGRAPGVGMKPLEFDNQSAIAGEGAAFFLLTRDEGEKPPYGYVTDVQFGSARSSGPKTTKDSLLILGADGHKTAGIHYAGFIPAHEQAAVYTPLYGSFPTGPAFDMAVAALSIREGRIFAAPKMAWGNSGLNIAKEEENLDAKTISCLKFGCNGEYGMINLVGT